MKNPIEDYLYKQVLKVLEDEKGADGEALREYSGSDKVISSLEMAEKIKQQKDDDWSIKLGLPTLDNALEGIDVGSLVVISGPTANGKTKLTETITLNLIDQGHCSLWFTFELAPKILMRRFGDKVPVFYLPSEIKDNKIKWVEERILESKEKFGTTAVFIDHLHFLFDMSGVQNTSLVLGNIVRQLKLLALKHEIVIFLVAHTSMSTYKDKMTLGSIRDSSFISQEADAVLMIARQSKENERGQQEFLPYSDISILKNRKTGILKTGLCALKDGKFVEVKDIADEAKEIFV